MKTLRYAVVAAAALLATGIASAGHHEGEKERLERAGNCRDAKQQMDYFCNPQNSANDTMVAVGTACNNAKNNVKAACEGIDQPDAEYKFEQ